jgi:competence protein ComEC
MQKSNKPGLFTNRPALLALVIYAIGIYLGIFITISALLIFGLSILLLFIGAYFKFKRMSNSATILFYVALAFEGVLQYRLAVDNFPPNHVKKIAEYGGKSIVSGKIIEEPDIRIDKTYLTISVDSVIWRKMPIASTGKVLVKIKKTTNIFSFGDKVRFEGYLFAPGESRVPGGFDYANYLSNHEIFAMMVLSSEEDLSVDSISQNPFLKRPYEYFINKIVNPIRGTYIEGYKENLPPELSSLLAGLTLGEKREIPVDIAKLFSDTGTLHLMAVSGSNVAIVATFFIWILARGNRGVRIMVTLGAVILFCFLTRNEPSVVRATVMASVGLIGFYRRRNADALGLLGFAGLIILIWRPLWLFSIGFQLSMAASAGIIYFVPKINSLINLGDSILSKIARVILAALVTTIAAQIAVLPVTAQYFQRLPLAGLIANLPMLLLASVVTVAGILFLPFILIGGMANLIYANILSWPLQIIKPLLGFFANLPFAVIDVNPPGVLKIIVFYALVYFLGELLFIKRFSKKAAALAGISIIGIFATGIARGPEGDSLMFIDCGTDRAVLYGSNEGRHYLWYDCHEADSCEQLKMTLAPFLGRAGINKIDTLFTNNAGRIRSLAKRIRIGNILQYGDIKYGIKSDTLSVSPYLTREFILNDKVNVGQIQSDNNKELTTGSIFFSLKMAGRKCILAGNMESALADGAIMTSVLIELPWSVQPYGIVYEKLKSANPEIIVFSQGYDSSISLGKRAQLTYLNERTWATNFTGSFRIRFEGSEIKIDHMIEPR